MINRELISDLPRFRRTEAGYFATLARPVPTPVKIRKAVEEVKEIGPVQGCLNAVDYKSLRGERSISDFAGGVAEQKTQATGLLETVGPVREAMKEDTMIRNPYVRGLQTLVKVAGAEPVAASLDFAVLVPALAELRVASGSNSNEVRESARQTATKGESSTSHSRGERSKLSGGRW